MTKAESFRPLTGDLSSLHEKSGHKATEKRFPSPYRGLIFLTRKNAVQKNFIIVSVPLQGTYLPYVRLFESNGIRWEYVSVPLQGTYLPYPVRATHEFPYASTALCVGKRK